MSKEWLDTCTDYPKETKDGDEYEDNDFDYNDYLGRVVNRKNSEQLLNKYGHTLYYGGECARCHRELCHDHLAHQCPDYDTSHMDWCHHNSTIEDVISEHMPEVFDGKNYKEREHIVNHVGDEISLVTKNLYDSLAAANPSGIFTDHQKIEGFKKANDYYTKLIPEAIKTGTQKASFCSNPYNFVSWDE